MLFALVWKSKREMIQVCPAVAIEGHPGDAFLVLHGGVNPLGGGGKRDGADHFVAEHAAEEGLDRPMRAAASSWRPSSVSRAEPASQASMAARLPFFW